MPKLIVFESEVAPPTAAVVASWYSSGVPNWYGHQRAEFVAGSGSVVCTYGSRSATCPVVSRKVLPQRPAFMSGASGFQSTVQKDRSLQPCAGGVTRIATAFAAPGWIRLVTLYSCTAIVPTALASSWVPFSQIWAR